MDHRFVLLGLVVLIAGCGGGGGGVPAVRAPEVTSAAVTPAELTFVGGELNITVEAEAYGGRGIAGVNARITGPSVNEVVGLARDGDQWRGTYTVPANGGGITVNYVVSITATDDANADSEAVTRGFTVSGVPAPPPPPVWPDYTLAGNTFDDGSCQTPPFTWAALSLSAGRMLAGSGTLGCLLAHSAQIPTASCPVGQDSIAASVNQSPVLRHCVGKSGGSFMTKLRVGVIGVGKMAEICHLPILATLPQVDLVAFCDTDAENLAARGEQYGVAKRYASHYDLFDSETLDAVCVFIPPFAHTDAEIIAAQRGIHVFVEKPPALTMQKAHEINAAIQDAGIVNAVGFNRRYSKTAEAARAMLAGSDIVQALVCRLHGSRALAWWWMRQDTSGGPFVENTIHAVDLIRYLGAEYTAVTARSVIRTDSTEELDIPLSMCATYWLEGGGVANVTTCAALDGYGHQGFLVIAGGHLYDLGGSQLSVDREEKATDEPERGDYRAQFASFVDAILENDPGRVRSPYGDAVKSLAAVLAAAESADSDGALVDLKQPPYCGPTLC